MTITITSTTQKRLRWSILAASCFFAISACSLSPTAHPTNEQPNQVVAQHVVEQVQEQKTPLAFTDIMQFREIERQVWDDAGRTYAYSAVPDRGDAVGYVHLVQENKVYQVERGVRPKITSDGRFVAWVQEPTLLEKEQYQALQGKEKSEAKKPTKGTVVLDTQTGAQTSFDDVLSFAFTGDGNQLVLLVNHEKTDSKEAKKKTKQLVIYNLNHQSNTTVEDVASYSVAKQGSRLVYLTQASKEQTGQVILLNTANGSSLTLHQDVGQASAKFAFNDAGERLAMTVGTAGTTKDDTTRELWLYTFKEGQVQVDPASLVTSYSSFDVNAHAPLVVSQFGKLEWAQNDRALRFSVVPQPEAKKSALEAPQTQEDLYAHERLLSDVRLQVWHGDDDRIITQQKVLHKSMQEATYEAVYWLDSQQTVLLTDNLEQNSRWYKHHDHAVLVDPSKHVREATWAGYYTDLYHLNTRTGEKQLIQQRMPAYDATSLSPNGRYIAYFEQGKLMLWDSEQNKAQQLGKQVKVSWLNEEEDRPTEPSPYGFGGWVADSQSFYVYDRFDIWQVDLDGTATNLTQSRKQQVSYRIEPKDERRPYQAGEILLVKSFHDKLKTSGFYALNPETKALGLLRASNQGQKSYRVVKRFDHDEQASGLIYFTEEDFRQFPNVWAATSTFEQAQQVTDINPQQADFAWGDAELVEWKSTKGVPLQGILLKPDNYDPNKRYPVIVYYYEKFSQRVHQYNQMKVNHRPNFPYYLGQDYVVFLPDIHFRLGYPGPSATESLVPAMEMLIKQGIADPKALGIHGHSWSGYQTAFLVTETDIFTAAVSGAPVSNMTSAYSGIRWDSGLARQFQYETGQSRIGPSLVENYDLYIANSPVFFADKINTPMLIQFGDIDGAVPWEQGIEYYLALRRYNKPVVMLQYEGEPHHLKHYPNKLDYSIKMAEFFDYYLKGKPAPQWWIDGVPYQDTSKKSSK